MATQEKRKRDDKENKEGPSAKQAKTTKGDDRPIVVDLSGKEKRYLLGTTLNDLRIRHGNQNLWLLSTLDDEFLVGAYALEAHHKYELKLPDTSATVTPPAFDTKFEVRELLKNIPSASIYGNPTHANGFKSSRHTDCIKVHRCTSGTPVVLLDPVLSELYNDLVNKAYTPTSEDCKSARELMEMLSKGFIDEVNDMQPKIKAWASKEHPGWGLEPDPGRSDSKWVTSAALLINIEEKCEKATGSVCSYMQNIGYYMKHWADNTTDRIAARSNCPTILIEITGPEIAVNGAVLTEEGVLVDPFATASMLCNFYDYNHLVSAARVIGAVTKAAKKLKVYYENLTSDKPDDSVPSDGFPIFRSFPPTLITGLSNSPLPELNIKLTYKRKLKELLYVGEIKIGEDLKEVVVKFTHSYNKKAHEICLQNGCAPTLYFAGETSRFQVIIMEYIPDAKQWDQVNDGEKKSTAMGLITNTIEKLHACELVHGDLRSSNILLYGDNQVAIIDFDWSGPPTQAYPFFMNHTSLKWPEGASDGKPLAYTHDNEWIKHSFV